MSIFSRLSLVWKVLLLLLLGILSSIAAAATYHAMLGRLSGNIKSTLSQGTARSEQSLELSEVAFRTTGQLQAIIREKDPDKLETEMQDYEARVKAFAQKVASLGADGQAIDQHLQTWLQTSQQVIDRILLGDAAQANQIFINSLQVRQAELLDAIGEYTRAGNQAMNDSAAELIETTERSRQRMVLTVVGVSLGLGVLGVFTALRVARPLKNAIATLTAGALQVTDAATQVSSASQSSAQNASEQTVRIEETSSTLSQFAVLLESTTASAKKADEVASNAKSNALEGKQTMQKLDESIKAINDSANEMGKIIRVIEEIAFQTNLLALNAAVEAARAGEQGKGFAVVAEEVRSLALRSSEAARNTGTLISQSMTRAKDGVQVCSAVARDLDTIVGSIASVADLMVEIRASSTNQHEQINAMRSAVSQIAEATGRNASVAEETASASEELTAMAATLRSGTVDALSKVVLGKRAA